MSLAIVQLVHVLLMNANQFTELISSIRLVEEMAVGGEEVVEEEEKEEAEFSAMQRTDAEYTRTVEHRLRVLAKAIKASGGDMQTPIVVGALKALRDLLTSSFWAKYGDTSMTIMRNLYENKLSLVKKFSERDGAWSTVAKAPETEITCNLGIENGWYHLAVYDSLHRHLASGYINGVNMQL